VCGSKKPGNTPKLSKALWKNLNPVGTVEEMLAVEIVRAAWRLHRCAVAEPKIAIPGNSGRRRSRPRLDA
jgi:hypothetical protein